jgi:tRNA (cytosine49-C5)-methyltransferase
MTKRTNEAERLERKRAAWVERTGVALGIKDRTAVIRLLSQERRQSLRLNPLVARPDETLIQLKDIGWHGKPYAWADNCYTIEDSALAVRDSALVASGAVFMQNAASWLPVLALNPQPGERILDVCAAPGGKTSHMAAVTNNQARLWVNDNSRARLLKMQANFKRLNVMPEDMTLYDATQLARKLDGQLFDKILLDAPCSGEGMMRYDRDKDFATWSVAHIKRLQQLQKRIITQAWALLAPGGMLVYSTCTMAPEEDEAVVDYVLRTHQEAAIVPFATNLPNRVPAVATWNGRTFSPVLAGCLRLAPSEHIEAFFVCRLRKSLETPETMPVRSQPA